MRLIEYNEDIEWANTTNYTHVKEGVSRLLSGRLMTKKIQCQTKCFGFVFGTFNYEKITYNFKGNEALLFVFKPITYCRDYETKWWWEKH